MVESRALVLVVCASCLIVQSPPPRPPPPPQQQPLQQQPLQQQPAPIAIANDGPAELVVGGHDEVVLGEAPRKLVRACVHQQGRLGVDGSATIVLAGDRTTVIGGRGIGPTRAERAHIRIEASGSPDIYVLCDNATAPIDLELHAPHAKLHVAITGKAGLNVSGESSSMESFGGWGLPAQFPECNEHQDRERDPSFPPSRELPSACVGNYHASNYTAQATGDTELHVIGVYEGHKHVDGPIVVHVRPTARPVVLALSAYQTAIWQIDLARGARVAAIYTGGYNAQRVEAPPGIPIRQLTAKTYAYGWEPKNNTGGGSYAKMIAGARADTGLSETSYQGCYAGNEFTVPMD